MQNCKVDFNKELTGALSLAALCLLIPANFYPILTIYKAGLEEHANLFDIILRVFDSSIVISLISFFCLVLAPSFILINLIYSSFFSIDSDCKVRQATLNCHSFFRTWSMIEVFLLAVLASLVKLNEMVNAEIGNGTLFFVGFWICLYLADRNFQIKKTDAINESSAFNSFIFAFVALCLLIPANIFVILNITKYGVSKKADLWHSVMELFTENTWPVGLIVLLASFISPWIKIFAMFYLSSTAQNGKNTGFKLSLHRSLEAIGKWAMVDIFVATILVAIVRLDELASINIEQGAIYFALMVLATLIASSVFDHRILHHKSIKTIS